MPPILFGYEISATLNHFEARMRTLFLLSILSTLCSYAHAAAPDWKDRDFIPLWKGEAPGQQGATQKDIPDIQLWKPEEGKATGVAVVVCPGGGYGGLAMHEGPGTADWLAKNGILAVVLRYRLGPKYHHPIELGDAQRAIRYTRAHAEEWKIDPHKIGILGYSAGGHLASTASTHYADGDPKSEDPIERVSSRPDFSILIYPVIKMGPGGHGGSTNNLLGKNPDPKLLDELSNEKHVDAKTPPAFLVHGADDKAVPIANSEDYVAAMKKAGVEVEFIRMDHGPHGFGLGESLKVEWPDKCLAWLKKIKMTP
ncbi:MAG TPA: alpha/beta hydrolase [Planctomycetota bacterium]|nr:alpha/beta hydrolase [Planctomycetota bacterium]